ncbi:hypothetical protein ACRJ4B_51020 [Streptomyces sp. GTA36]
MHGLAVGLARGGQRVRPADAERVPGVLTHQPAQHLALLETAAEFRVLGDGADQLLLEHRAVHHQPRAVVARRVQIGPGQPVAVGGRAVQEMDPYALGVQQRRYVTGGHPPCQGDVPGQQGGQDREPQLRRLRLVPA